MKDSIPFLPMLFILFAACSPKLIRQTTVDYDMRKDLNPRRLAIAMWDFSWLYMHYKGGAFEDFNKVTDELLERKFNAVRIDAFPLIIGKLTDESQEITITGDSSQNWGATDRDRKHNITKELLEFMQIAKQKKIQVILSTWGSECKEFKNIKNDFNTTENYWAAWEKVLDLLAKNNLLDMVTYVDLDQEFPFFSPFNNEIERLKKKAVSDTAKTVSVQEAMNLNVAKNNILELNGFKWNTAQMLFVKYLMEQSLMHFQEKYPYLRFTYSLTSFWDEVRSFKITKFDVLELHFWMSQDERFESRSTFSKIPKDRGNHDYTDYMKKVDNTLSAIRPMMLKSLHNRLAFAQSWSDEIAAPLTTTEAWGPWWHTDSKYLDWQWLYDWCEEGMKLAAQYKLWGATPWNFAHPYWRNWKNVTWYKKLNSAFLESK